MKNAIQLSIFGVTEVMLTYRSKIHPSDRKRITCSRDAYDSFIENWNDDTLEYFEEFKVLRSKLYVIKYDFNINSLYIISIQGIYKTWAERGGLSSMIPLGSTLQSQSKPISIFIESS